MPVQSLRLYRARALVDTACKEKRVSLIIKDVSWLWRTAYNCATQGCTEWDNSEERVPPLFDVSREVRPVFHPGYVVLQARGGPAIGHLHGNGARGG